MIPPGTRTSHLTTPPLLIGNFAMTTPGITDDFGQKFTSSLSDFRMITEDGTTLSFKNNMCITKNSKIITYLKAQIVAGVPGIKFSGKATSDDVDPLAGVKRRIADKVEVELRASIRAELEAELGNTNTGIGPKLIVPASTTTLAPVLPGASISKP